MLAHVWATVYVHELLCMYATQGHCVGDSRGGSRIWQWGGPRFVGKRVTYTSEVSYERSELRAK